MPFSQELVDELNVMMHFSLSSTLEGIKVHTTAEPAVIAATQRLYDKGLVTQMDGGYLTDLGREVTEHAALVLTILNSERAIT